MNIKDIYEYLSSKLNDGSLAIFVRKAPIQIKKYEEQLIIWIDSFNSWYRYNSI